MANINCHSSGDACSIYDGWCRTKVESTNFTYVWTIENFSLLQKKVGESVVSDDFVVATSESDTVWRLRLYPNGSDDKNEGSVGLFLVNLSVVELFATYSLYILDVKKERYNNIKISRHFTPLTGYGFPCFIKRCDLAEKASQLLPNDQLTICCDMTIIRPSDISSRSEQKSRINFKTEGKFFEELRSLFDRNFLSDVTLVVGEKEFRAHKAILAARSPVFAAMFDNDLNENLGKGKKVMKITEVEVNAFENVLVYMYSGKLPTLDGRQMIQDVLYAAKKYKLRDLTLMCEITLAKMLTTETAAEILAFAEMHHLISLKKRVARYVVKNAAVLNTEAWKLIENNYPNVVVEIFRAYVNGAERTPEMNTSSFYVILVLLFHDIFMLLFLIYLFVM